MGHQPQEKRQCGGGWKQIGDLRETLEGGHEQEPAEQGPSLAPPALSLMGLHNDSLGCPKKCDLEQITFSKKMLSKYMVCPLLLDARERVLGKAQVSWRGLKVQFGEIWGGLLDTQEVKVIETPGLPPRVLNLQPLLPSWVGQQAGRD